MTIAMHAYGRGYSPDATIQPPASALFGRQASMINCMTPTSWGVSDTGSLYVTIPNVRGYASGGSEIVPLAVPMEGMKLAKMDGAGGSWVQIVDDEGLYHWVTRSWWPGAATVVEPRRHVIVTFPEGERPVRWARNVDFGWLYRRFYPDWSFVLNLLRALPAGVWPSCNDFGRMVSRLSFEPGLLYPPRTPVLGGYVWVSGELGPEPIRAHDVRYLVTSPSRIEPGRSARNDGPKAAFVTARVIRDAQVELASIMRPWLEAWAEGMGYAPWLLATPWIASAINSILVGRRAKDEGVPADETKWILVDAGVPLTVAEELTWLPPQLALPEEADMSAMGPFLVSWPFTDTHGQSFIRLVLADVPQRMRRFLGKAIGLANWSSTASLLVGLAAQEGILVSVRKSDPADRGPRDERDAST